MKIRIEDIKKIIFKFTGKKLVIAIGTAHIEFIILMIIFGVVHSFINVFKKYGFYNIPQPIENIHIYQFLILYIICIFKNIIQILFEKREKSRSRYTALLNLINGPNKIQAVTYDACSDGVGIFPSIPLKEGQTFKLSHNSLPYPYEDVIVRWYDKETQKCGLMFIKNK